MPIHLRPAVTAALLILFALSIRTRAAGQTPFVLAENGRPAATIVVAAAASENARTAARELQTYVERISGARLPIVSDTETPTGRLILVGRSRLTDAVPGLHIPEGRTAALKEEGFCIRTSGDRLILAGNDTEPYLGTRYAVVELLHRLGVRWFIPGPFGEVVPRSPTISLPPLNLEERPSFLFREFWDHHAGTEGQERDEWKIHHFLNPRMARWVGVPGDGTLADLLPKDQFKAHPDWFAMRKDGSRDDHMACMTSPGMIEAMVERLKAEARKGVRVAAFSPDDGAPRCYCPRCTAMASAFDGYGSNDRDPWPESSTSQEWFYFVNQILEGVNREYPEFRIATNGYSNRELAPDLPDFNRRHNLVVMFANIGACTIHAYDDPGCWQMRRQGEMIRQWTRVCDKVWVYGYNNTLLVNKGTLVPVVHRVRRCIPLLAKWGVIGFDDEDEDDWSMSGIPTRLVRSALEWNAQADVDALLSDYFSRWFGPAAGPMRAYYDALESAFEQAEVHGHEDVILNPILTPGLMGALDASMQQAEKLATAEPERTRVHLERLMYDHLRDYVALEAAKRVCHFREAAQRCAHMIALKAEMHTVTPFMGWYPYPAYGVAWEQKRMEDLAQRIEGSKGRLVALLPETARFRLDPHDDGRYAGWFEPAFADSSWERVRTTAGWETQGHQDREGHPERGIGWYRMSVDVPDSAAGKPVRLLAPAVVSEVWLWVNGEYAGHRPYLVPWSRPHELDLDVTPYVRPGARNEITLRVLSNFEVFGASGVYERMFLYSPALGAEARSQINAKE